MIIDNIDFQNTAGYSFTGGEGASADIVGPDNLTIYGGGSKRKSTKRKSTKRKSTKRKSTKRKSTKKLLRKPISNKVKQMSKLRRKNIKFIEKREKILSKRLKNRKHRNDIIDSLVTNEKIPQQTVNKLSPNLKNFISKLPTDSTKLTSWPSLGLEEPEKHPGTRTLNSARAKLAEALKLKHTKKISKPADKKQAMVAVKNLKKMLEQSPVYKDKSVIKFSDYKSKTPSKLKAALKKKKRRKGSVR